MENITTAAHKKLWRDLRALSDAAKKAGIVMLTATQPFNPDRRLPRYLQSDTPIFIDYVSAIGG